MKNFKYILTSFLAVLLVFTCANEDDDTDFVNQIEAPKNVSALITVTQDNTGLVTITPLGEGAVSYKVNYGDDSELSEDLNPGQSTQHTYEEGVYNAIIVATGLNGKTTSVTQEVVVSFQAPQNLVVTIENDTTISKQVNIDADADFALSYEVDFGDGSDPIMTNFESPVSYQYADAGIYTITVTAFSAAIETTIYTEDFEVTAILQPVNAAPTQPARADADVISIYSGYYDNIAGTNYYPNWGQTTTYTELDINGDATIQYSNLNYQGIEYGETIDASTMEYLHIDVWTADAPNIQVFPISIATGEQQVTLDLVADQWNSFNIPLSDFTSQGLSMDDIHQFKFVGSGTVFIDNIYYYRQASGPTGPNLIVNGDFENGSSPWIIGVDDSTSAPVVTNSGNTYYSVNVTAAGNPYDVNVSQKLEIIQGNTYTLSFDAWSDVNRSIIAGIGLSADPWNNNTETVNITSSVSTYTLTLTATDFGATDARVIFDLGADVGEVNIDNVSLVVNNGNPDLVVNGDFENGSSPWIIGVDDSTSAPVVTNSGNTYYSVNVTAAGNPYDVNVSQKLEIIQGNTYTLSFDAWSDVNRSIIAGIGLSADPWNNNTETVNITSSVSTYTLTLTATDFGATDARIIFDLGAEVGEVNIDNVSLFVN